MNSYINTLKAKIKRLDKGTYDESDKILKRKGIPLGMHTFEKLEMDVPCVCISFNELGNQMRTADRAHRFVCARCSFKYNFCHLTEEVDKSCKVSKELLAVMSYLVLVLP